MKNLTQNIDKVFAKIKSDFSNLWSLKHRQDTVEIITPYTTLAGNAISVFLTQREIGYVVADGGHLAEVSAEQDFSCDNPQLHCQELQEKFGLKRLVPGGNRPCMWYKTAPDIARLSACIYDVALFQNAVTNALYQQTMFSAEESSERRRFDTHLKEVLARKVLALSSPGRQFEVMDDASAKFLRFTFAIRRVGVQAAWLGMGIHRSNPLNFQRSVAMSSFAFTSADEQFPGYRLHKGAILDVLPEKYQANENMKWLQAKVDNWNGVQKLEMLQIENMSDMSLLLGRDAA